MFDAVLSFSVLICAIVFMTTGISFEAYIGAVISCFIIKAGVEMMAETVNDLLGRRTDKKTADKVRRILEEEPLVRGAHDLFLYNFGPDRNYASVHLELPDTMTVEEVDRLTRKVEPKVFRETGVILTGVGVYSQNTGNDEAAKIQKEVRGKVMAHGWALGFHGFHLDEKAREMRFDVVMSFDIMPRKGVEILQEEIGQLYPNYNILIVPDVDISD